MVLSKRNSWTPDTDVPCDAGNGVIRDKEHDTWQWIVSNCKNNMAEEYANSKFSLFGSGLGPLPRYPVYVSETTISINFVRIAYTYMEIVVLQKVHYAVTKCYWFFFYTNMPAKLLVTARRKLNRDVYG